MADGDTHVEQVEGKLREAEKGLHRDPFFPEE
jgi:hypothetical protein